MKKVILFALVAAFASCNSSTTETAPVTDSTAVVNQDSVAVADSSVTATDTTTAQIGKQ